MRGGNAPTPTQEARPQRFPSCSEATNTGGGGRARLRAGRVRGPAPATKRELSVGAARSSPGKKRVPAAA